MNPVLIRDACTVQDVLLSPGLRGRWSDGKRWVAPAASRLEWAENDVVVYRHLDLWLYQ